MKISGIISKLIKWSLPPAGSCCLRNERLYDALLVLPDGIRIYAEGVISGRYFPIIGENIPDKKLMEYINIGSEMWWAIQHGSPEKANRVWPGYPESSAQPLGVHLRSRGV